MSTSLLTLHRMPNLVLTVYRMSTSPLHYTQCPHWPLHGWFEKVTSSLTFPIQSCLHIKHFPGLNLKWFAYTILSKPGRQWGNDGIYAHKNLDTATQDSARCDFTVHNQESLENPINKCMRGDYVTGL